MTQSFKELPLDFRSEVVDTLMRYIKAGDSCMVVGIGSVGKSNLMRFLQRKDVQQEKLGKAGDHFLFVYLDKNKLLEQSMWGLMELMIHQIWMTLSLLDVEADILRQLEILHDRSVDQLTRHVALRYLEHALVITCKKLQWRLVFILDDFDELYNALPAHSLAALRALRDEFKYHLTYLAAARIELPALREAAIHGEAFEGLLASRLVWLGPHRPKDAAMVLERLESRYRLSANDQLRELIIASSGGHPGLMQTIFLCMTAGHREPGSWIVDENVILECSRIWRSLSVEEQRTVMEMVKNDNTKPTKKTLEQLHSKGVMGGPWAIPNKIFASLFSDYVNLYLPIVGAHIEIDAKRRLVLVNGNPVSGLSPLEYSFVEFLVKNRGHACSRNDLIDYMYPEDRSEGEAVSDEALAAIVKRVRKKIEPSPEEPCFIITVRGYGFKLEDGQTVES